MCELFKPQAMEWFPEHIFSGEESLVLLILNQPLQKECEVFLKKIWKSALFRVAVDGGANVLKELSGEEITFIPELVCGDFDSATPEVLNFYRSQVKKELFDFKSIYLFVSCLLHQFIFFI
ncbi:UNVERIFIED_CONTAM: Tpk1 [Trichonephila clavipes]